MPYKRYSKPLYKRKSSTRGRATRARAPPKKKYTTFANKVKKALRKVAETKQYTGGFVDQNIDQRLDTTNQQRFLFQPTQGAQQDQRVGNTVYVKGVRVSAVFTIMQNMDYPHMVKLVLYKLKQGTNIPSQAQLDRMVNLGSSATHLGETIINLIRPLNRDLFTFHKVKMVKMAKSQHGTGTSNNDYLFTYYVKWWIPIKKNVIFDDNDTNVPVNWSMFFGAAAVRSDGDIASPQSAVVNYDMDYTFYYNDV
jgi:hypothetical protein